MYIFTFGLLGLFALVDVFLKKKQYHLGFIIIIVLWLVFHDGFRWGIATDWGAYLRFFNDSLVKNDDGMEIGYVWLNQMVRTFTDNYSYFLILHAVLVYALISRSIYKYSPNALFSFFFFYCMMLTYLGMNRQYIAFAICIYSYKFIFEKKIIYFLVCIAVAFLFHRSAIMFAFAYYLNKEFSIKYLIFIFSTVLLISLSGIINRLPLNLFFLLDNSIGEKMDFYSQSYELNTNILFTILALLKRCIWIILAIAYKKGIKNKDQYFDFFFNLYFVGAVVYILFNNTILQVIVARGLLYFNIAEIFLIPYVLTIFKEGITKRLVFVLVAIYAFLLIEKGINFYQEDLGVDIYRPYNSVLLDDKYDAMNK
jgi:hypothetical protein